MFLVAGGKQPTASQAHHFLSWHVMQEESNGFAQAIDFQLKQAPFSQLDGGWITAVQSLHERLVCLPCCPRPVWTRRPLLLINDTDSFAGWNVLASFLIEERPERPSCSVAADKKHKCLPSYYSHFLKCSWLYNDVINQHSDRGPEKME